MYFRNASGVLTRIAVGSNNHVLTLDGAVPGWEAAAGGGAVSAVANGSDNRIATFSSSDALNGEANLTFDGTDLAATLDTATFTSANADDPLIIIKNTTNDASGARLRFVKDKGAAGAADDIAGIIEFYADDAAQDQVKFGSITSLVKVHTNGQEGGELVLEVASHDGESVPGLILVDGSGEDEIDVTIASGANSVTTIAGDAIVTGDVLSVTHYIQHEGDADTRLVFTANQMNVEVGGINAAKFTTTELAINEAAGNVDFRVESQNESHMLFMDAANNRISIGDSANAPAATLEITNHASSGAFDVPLLQLNSNDVDQIALDINAVNTTANIIDIVADDVLTSGKVLHIDINDAATTAVTPTYLHFDFDKDGVIGAGVTSTYTAFDIDMDDAATNNGSSTVTMTGLDIDIVSANAQGTLLNVGAAINVKGADTNISLLLENTVNDTNGASLRFLKDKGAAASDNDVVGVIEFNGDNDAQEEIQYAQIAVEVADASDGTEGGRLLLGVATHDGEMQFGLVLEDGDAEDEIDVIIGNGADSVTTVSGDLVVTTTTTYTAASVHNFVGDDAAATIPITKTYIVVDANGSARQGMRFGGAGVAGQILYVKNSGGENIAFHSTPGTALITTTASTDTILPEGVHHFVSDGSGWYLIGPPMSAGS